MEEVKAKYKCCGTEVHDGAHLVCPTKNEALILKKMHGLEEENAWLKSILYKWITEHDPAILKLTRLLAEERDKFGKRETELMIEIEKLKANK